MRRTVCKHCPEDVAGPVHGRLLYGFILRAGRFISKFLKLCLGALPDCDEVLPPSIWFILASGLKCSEQQILWLLVLRPVRQSRGR